MIRCIKPEPDAPEDPGELEIWCAKGYSAQPVQAHIGDSGRVMWTTEDGNVAIAFDDGDERVLYPEEIEWITPPG
jgi:hypothetical protein